MSESGYEIDLKEIDRKRMVLDYIINNQGCSNRDIISELSFNKNVVSKIVNELIADGIIQNLGGRKKQNVLVPIDENEISFTEAVLLNFKQGYSVLLDEILNHTLVRSIIDSLSFDMSAKESDIMNRTAEIWKDQHSEYNQSKELYSKISEHIDRISDMLNFQGDNKNTSDLSVEENQLSWTIRNDTNPQGNKLNYNMSQSQIKMDVERNRLIVTEIDKIRELQILYSNQLQKCAYLVLTSWPIFLSLFLSLLISYRSLFIWPRKVLDKRIFFDLTEFTNRSLQDINRISYDFLSKTKNQRMKSEFDLLRDKFCLTEKHILYSKLYYDFSIMGLKQSAMNVLESLNRLDEKRIEYDLEVLLDSIYQNSKSVIDTK